MIVNRNLDHRRADYAYQRINDIKENNNDKIEKRYHSAVRSSSALIQKSGLIQTLSFYISKKKDDRDESGNQDEEKKSNLHYEFLAKHILNWILFYDTSNKFIDYDENVEPLKLYLSLLECTDEEIIQKTQESKDLMLWFKRFADAMLKSGE